VSLLKLNEPSNVASAIDKIAETIGGSPADDPVKFVLDLAHRWKLRGGTVAGKPRHSDRYLDDLLRKQGTPIKSLTPKLAGKTNLRPADARALISLSLSHWEYVSDAGLGSTAETWSKPYKPMLPDDLIEEVSRYLVDRISEAWSEGRKEAETAAMSSMPGEDTFELISNEFQEADALFTVGAGQTVLVTQPEMVLIGFKRLINRLWDIDRSDDQARVLIWILDLGRQDFEDPESRLRFMNVEALISRFKALRLFKENATEERWNWLQSKSIIVLHDTRSVRPDVPRLPAFDSHHVLFSAIPPRWAGLSEFRALYGREFERLSETNYTIFLTNFAERRVDQRDSATDRNYELRYFGHALFKSDGNDNRQARGLRLNPPGRSYVEALGTVYAAAAQILDLHVSSGQLLIDGMRINRVHAIEKLQHHGFLLLRLEEFLKRF
jgi:hypothetical protein